MIKSQTFVKKLNLKESSFEKSIPGNTDIFNLQEKRQDN